MKQPLTKTFKTPLQNLYNTIQNLTKRKNETKQTLKTSLQTARNLSKLNSKQLKTKTSNTNH